MNTPLSPQQAAAFQQAAQGFRWRAAGPRPAPAPVVQDGRPRTWSDKGTLPPAVDLRARGHIGQIKNQQLSNACTSFALAAAAEAAVSAAGAGKVVLAPWFVHTCLLGAAPDEGVYLHDAVRAVEKGGIARTTDSDVPWSKSSCATANVQGVRAGIQVADETAAKQALANGNLVVCAAVVEWKSFWDLRKGEVYRYRPDVNGSSHCICLAGYDDNNGSWLILNSFWRRLVRWRLRPDRAPVLRHLHAQFVALLLPAGVSKQTGASGSA